MFSQLKQVGTARGAGVCQLSRVVFQLGGAAAVDDARSALDGDLTAAVSDDQSKMIYVIHTCDM